ncbi:hypothetical protein ACSF6V_01990 [Escherichia coli]|uniref:hypothetical protein n=1 Tax=Escherichia coli TaxID=562 RepID=UPI003EEABA88
MMLKFSNAPLSLLCSATSKFRTFSCGDSADLNEKGDFLNISKPISYIASLAPEEVTRLALV